MSFISKPYTTAEHLRLFDPGHGDLETLQVIFIFDDDIADLIEQQNAGCTYAKEVMDAYTHFALRDTDNMGYAFSNCLTCSSILSRNRSCAILIRNWHWLSKRSWTAHGLCIRCARYKGVAQYKAMQIIDRVIEQGCAA